MGAAKKCVAAPVGVLAAIAIAVIAAALSHSPQTADRRLLELTLPVLLMSTEWTWPWPRRAPTRPRRPPAGQPARPAAPTVTDPTAGWMMIGDGGLLWGNGLTDSSSIRPARPLQTAATPASSGATAATVPTVANGGNAWFTGDGGNGGDGVDAVYDPVTGRLISAAIDGGRGGDGGLMSGSGGMGGNGGNDLNYGTATWRHHRRRRRDMAPAESAVVGPGPAAMAATRRDRGTRPPATAATAAHASPDQSGR